MTLQEVNTKILRGQYVGTEDVLEALVKFYEYASNLNDNQLHNDHENLAHITHDMSKLGSLISTVGLAKSIAETVLEHKLSTQDKAWRDEDITSYKLSVKSSTIHHTNLKGHENVKPFNLIAKLMVSLYYDINTKFKALQSISANLKFEIEKGILDYTVKRTY